MVRRPALLCAGILVDQCGVFLLLDLSRLACNALPKAGIRFVHDPGALLYGGIQSGYIAVPEPLTSLIHHRGFYYGYFFVLGVATFYMTEHSERSRRLLDNNVAFLCLLGVIVIAAYMGNHRLAVYAIAVPLLVRSAHAAPLSGILLGNPVMLLIGELSYSIYLSHQFIHTLVMRLAQGNPVDPFYKWGSIYLLLLLWCLACYWMIEVPARTKLRALVKAS